MMEDLPTYVSTIFKLTSISCIVIFYWVVRNSTDEKFKNKGILVSILLLLWLIFQAFLSQNEVYIQDKTSLPPKIFLFGILPTIVVIALFFFTRRGKQIIDSLSIEKFSYIHLVRIPVEFVLWWLFLHGAIPELMTFEGWNFDIIMGLTAPLIIYFGFIKKRIGRAGLLAWNILGVVLLIVIFTLAILSAPFPLQQLAFDQPNIGLLHYPFSWLPTFVVPIVIFAHFCSIRQLLYKSN